MVLLKKYPKSKRYYIYGLILLFIGYQMDNQLFPILASQYYIPPAYFKLYIIAIMSIGLVFILIAYLSSSTQSLNIIDNDEKELSQKLKEIQKTLSKELKEEHIFSQEEKQTIESNLIQNMKTNITDSFLKSQSEILKDTLEKEITINSFNKQINQTKQRIFQEISNLKLRSNLNLSLGIVITLFGLYILWDMITINTSVNLEKYIINKDNTLFLKFFILEITPRILLVLLIEIFAYFFLRLYKNNLDEIKFFQNEITNIELKYLALSTVLTLDSKDSDSLLPQIISEFSKTERNYILEKGQTTVELEKARSEGENTKNIMSSLPKLFSSISDKKK